MSVNTFELITVKHPYYGTLVALQWILTFINIKEDKDRRDVIKKLLLGKTAYYSKLAVNYNPTVKQTGVWVIGKEAFEILIQKYKYNDLQYIYDLIFNDVEFPYYRSNVNGVFVVKQFDFEKCRVMHNKLSTTFEFEDTSKILTDPEPDIEETMTIQQPQNPFERALSPEPLTYNGSEIEKRFHNNRFVYNLYDICRVVRYNSMSHAIEYIDSSEIIQLDFKVEKKLKNQEPYWRQFFLTAVGVCDIIFHITKKDNGFNKYFVNEVINKK